MLKGLYPRACCKACSLIGKMLFFVDNHICTTILRVFIKNDLFKLFSLIVCFVLIKSYENYQEKRMRNARTKRQTSSRILSVFAEFSLVTARELLLLSHWSKRFLIWGRLIFTTHSSKKKGRLAVSGVNCTVAGPGRKRFCIHESGVCRELILVDFTPRLK